MANPKLLCLDEPSLGLAPAVIEDIGEKIRDIRKKRGTSILLVEQNVHLAFGHRRLLLHPSGGQCGGGGLRGGDP